MPKSIPRLCTPTVGAKRYFALVVLQLPGTFQTQGCPDVGIRYLSGWHPCCYNLPSSKTSDLGIHHLYSK